MNKWIDIKYFPADLVVPVSITTPECDMEEEEEKKNKKKKL